jgi:Cysteine-rich CPXCG
VTNVPPSDGPEEHDYHLDSQEDTTWETEAEVTCPYCGQGVTIALDPSGGPSQAYVEDCQVCCQPWQVHVSYDDRGVAQVWAEVA